MRHRNSSGKTYARNPTDNVQEKKKSHVRRQSTLRHCSSMSPMEGTMKAKKRQCKIFYCDRRRGRFCCADCGYKDCTNSARCKKPCLNDPKLCGAVLEKDDKMSKRQQQQLEKRSAGFMGSLKTPLPTPGMGSMERFLHDGSHLHSQRGGQAAL